MQNFFGSFVITDIGNIRISTIYGNNNCPSKLSLLHEHEDYELHIFSGGTGFVETEDDVYPFSHGTAILIPPGTVHWVNADNKKSTSDFTLMFSFETLKTNEFNDDRELTALLTALIPRPGEIRLVSDSFLCDLVCEIESVWESDDVFARATLKNCFDRLYLKFFKDLSLQKTVNRKTDISSAEAVERAYYDLVMAKTIETYIPMHVTDANIYDLSVCMNMSARNAQRIIKKIYGKSFSEKVTEYRMKKAASLIIEGGISFSQISRAVGYSQYSGFHKAFTLAFGMTPSQYKHKKINIRRVNDEKQG